ncbi:KpsF/GutQ family protein [Amylibacter marinus]|uniref:KpsF/GutQ family protein n=1 Tax=Amylibacter marinus TaxID=1475483 RepID=A0ABQ5VS45_9RHOB|nr:KpsF/GutQ family sugar-phosphate isomerase [Amylibacter marinus]GLQ33928.1 KpsF/GutQ family protein [Amylibacter marinus]
MENTASVKECLEIGTEALNVLTARLDIDDFAQAVDAAVSLLSDISGRLVVTGMGKSGIIGRKMVATFASTGTPSLFLHPAEASHGDLGMVQKGDVFMALSFSGESRELGDILRYAKRFAIPIIAMTANPQSTLGKAADIQLILPKVTESCPHNLAPTSSTLIQMALGDAIAITLLKNKGFSEQDFFNFHPGGKLGTALTPVSELMNKGADLPLAPQSATIADILAQLSEKGYGIIGLTDDQGTLSGVITDGDIRRYLAENTDGSMKQVMFETKGTAIMTKKFISVTPNQSCAKILGILEQQKISAAFVLDDARPIGLIRMLTLIQAGVA